MPWLGRMNQKNPPKDFECPRCGKMLTVDGYGDFIHRDTGKYHCADGHYVGVPELWEEAEKNDNR